MAKTIGHCLRCRLKRLPGSVSNRTEQPGDSTHLRSFRYSCSEALPPDGYAGRSTEPIQTEHGSPDLESRNRRHKGRSPVPHVGQLFCHFGAEVPGKDQYMVWA